MKNEEYTEQFAQELRSARLQLAFQSGGKVTQQSIAKKLKVTTGYLCALETARKTPNVEMLRKIIKVYPLSARALRVAIGVESGRL